MFLYPGTALLKPAAILHFPEVVIDFPKLTSPLSIRILKPQSGLVQTHAL
jgi:hypothetical protein